MYYERFGSGVFKAIAKINPPTRLDDAPIPKSLEAARARDASIWATLVNVERRVSREAYGVLARTAPKLVPARTLARATRRGRRPSHAVNDARTRS
jgi:hypothetical protein